ncbi:MAG TPA: hypothetical protein VFX43_18910 [Chitinophagaceae bacterium]|nr:hypothetical protein [Chitinophagaceae bacterium]
MKIEKELSEIRQVYAEADQSGKKLMELLYGLNVLGGITGRIVSFEHACQELNANPTKIMSVGVSTDEVAYRKLKVITEALNDGWTPDWSDDDEKKWYPWFDFQVGRFVFGSVLCFCTFSFLGSRLCFRTRELAEYAGKQFEDLYNQFLK